MMKQNSFSSGNCTDNSIKGCLDSQKVNAGNDSSSYPAFRVEGCETAYRDFLDATVQEIIEQWHPPKDQRKGPRGGVTEPFPVKLYKMLVEAEDVGFSHIVSWQPHGRCFNIRRPKDFEEQVISKYFRQTKLTSFQRQLNLYGFKRIQSGPDQGGHYSPLFLRGRPDICLIIRRTRLKGGAEEIVPRDMQVEESLRKTSFYALDTCPSASLSDFMSLIDGDSSKTALGEESQISKVEAVPVHTTECNAAVQQESTGTGNADTISDGDLPEALETNYYVPQVWSGFQMDTLFIDTEASAEPASVPQNKLNMLYTVNYSNAYPTPAPQALSQPPLLPTRYGVPINQDCQGRQHHTDDSQTWRKSDLSLTDALASKIFDKSELL